MNIIEFKNVSKNYGDKVVLNNMSFNIEEGKIYGLLGKNGSGKTTIIKLLTGLLKENSGSIKINGENINENTKKIVSYLPEKSYFNNQDKVKTVIEFFSDMYDDFDKDKCLSLLKDLDINVNSKIINLSKGMNEKLELSLVLSRKAKIYILDEPLGGVDPATRDYILDTILKNFLEDASLIISTHLISDIERILDEIIIINDGEVVISGNVDDVRLKENDSIDNIFRRLFKC